jgi:lipoate-protein ligase A
MKTKWRLVLDENAGGAWNMALDEALMLCHAAPVSDSSTRIEAQSLPAQVESAQPILRFYGWTPACLSLGRFQKWPESAESAGFDLVRRPSGGRAVWHQHEITYCAVLQEEFLPRDSRSVAGAYAWLSRGLVQGLKTLGVRATLAPSGRDRVQTADCFATATRADFVVDGRKLLGAAQLRVNGVVLQHGSLLLDVDETAWHGALGSAPRDVITLCSLGVAASREEIVAALCDGCENALDISLLKSTVSAAESALAQRLLTVKYADRAWNREARVTMRIEASKRGSSEAASATLHGGARAV